MRGRGGTAWIGLAAGGRGRARRPGRDPRAVLVGYANGYCGYLSTEAAFEQEGYEVMVAAIAAGEAERALAFTVGALQGRSERS